MNVIRNSLLSTLVLTSAKNGRKVLKILLDLIAMFHEKGKSLIAFLCFHCFKNRIHTFPRLFIFCITNHKTLEVLEENMAMYSIPYFKSDLCLFAQYVEIVSRTYPGLTSVS